MTHSQLADQLDLLRFAAPIAPGSESSRRAAEQMTVAKRRPVWLRVLEELSRRRYAVSREELSRLTGIKESTLCGRLMELKTALCVEASPMSCLSSAGVRVDGYRITACGRQRIAGAA